MSIMTEEKFNLLLELLIVYYKNNKNTSILLKISFNYIIKIE